MYNDNDNDNDNDSDHDTDSDHDNDTKYDSMNINFIQLVNNYLLCYNNKLEVIEVELLFSLT